MVMPFNVEELARRAEKVFVGTCTKVSHKVNDRGIPVVEVTFAVAETIKGEAGSTVTFQQFDAQPQPHPHRPPQTTLSVSTRKAFLPKRQSSACRPTSQEKKSYCSLPRRGN